MRRRGFTLIELLIVITIMALLMGMILAVVGPIRNAVKRSRTAAIQMIVHQALALHSAKLGGMPTTAEHPLAGSLATRTAFVRGTGTHAAVTTTGMALTGATSPADLTTGGDRLLLPDDLLAEKGIPGLYGLPRARLGILGPDTAEATGYLRIKHLPTPINPSVAANYVAVTPVEGPGERAAVLRYWFKGEVATELAKLNALYTPTDDVAGHLIAAGRAWSPEAAGEVASLSRIQDGGTWKSYRLRGTVVVDAWGREMLFSIRNDTNLVIESAGRDGCFRWNPGPNGTLQTDPWGPVAGDDIDAGLDNITLGRP